MFGEKINLNRAVGSKDNGGGLEEKERMVWKMSVDSRDKDTLVRHGDLFSDKNGQVVVVVYGQTWSGYEGATGYESLQRREYKKYDSLESAFNDSWQKDENRDHPNISPEEFPFTSSGR